MYGLKVYPSLGTTDYLATMVVQVETLARKSGHQRLAMILGAAREEALAIVKGEPGSPHEPVRIDPPDYEDPLDMYVRLTLEHRSGASRSQTRKNDDA